MTIAICVRCGSRKAAHDTICAQCGLRPSGEGLLVAWLLSDAYLSADALEIAAERVSRGEGIHPSAQMLDAARRALGRHASHDPGLTHAQRIGVMVFSLLFTSFPAIAWWWHWRIERPVSARQALAYSLPASPIVGVLVAYSWWISVIG